MSPDQMAAVAGAIVVVAIAVSAPRDVRARWWAALTRGDR